MVLQQPKQEPVAKGKQSPASERVQGFFITMKILLAAKHPHGGRLKIGGVQSWQETVAAELRQQGHVVDFWGPEFGKPSSTYDFGIFANLKATSFALSYCKSFKCVSHGIIPDEQGQDDWLFTSEEVRGNFRGEIIRQPVDLSFWKPGNEERKYLTCFSYRGELPNLSMIADDYALGYIRISNLEKENTLKVLQQSAVVVATGRAAVEAMACGCYVVIADKRGYQPSLVDFDTEGAMTRNYSGRGGVQATFENLSFAVKEAIRRGDLLDHVYQHHDAKKIVKQLC